MELYAEKVQQRGLSAVAQCESLRYKLLAGLAVRRYTPSENSILIIVLVMVFFDLLWNRVQRVVKLLFPENFVLLVQSQ